MRKLWISVIATFFISLVLGLLYKQIGGGIFLLASLAFGLGNAIILIMILYKSISRTLKS
ncbi:hypothetical protein F9B82_03875 [Lacticaseibacillus casei]|uniref:Uncharacterized protein n=1 Tax=Lacticaseibacillus casei TaxID=1582 RepID=A0AAN1EXW8_LACCA|nr:hypothetical protein BGL52_02240 [Lacticaseibacillus casei]KAB1970499.1 hypothetical protein F9B82_03875 [Lacticaseibacillus casei]